MSIATAYRIIGGGKIEGCGKYQQQDLCRCCAGYGRLMLFPEEEKVLGETEMNGLTFERMDYPYGEALLVGCQRDYTRCDEIGLKPLDCMTYPFTPMTVEPSAGGRFLVNLVLSDSCHLIRENGYVDSELWKGSFLGRVAEFAVFLYLSYPEKRKLVEWAAIAGKGNKPYRILTIEWPSMKKMREAGVEDAREMGASILQPDHYAGASK